ncbi:MAG: hypothetical protein Q9222_005082 [Ikaeria aurantiellina]
MTVSLIPPCQPAADLRPCLLCLHGGGTSAYILSLQTRRLQRALSVHYRFVFVDAPFECDAGPGVLPFFEGLGPYRRWINADGEDEGRVRPLLHKTMMEDGGDFVGVLGFSQGARLAVGLLHEQQQPGKGGGRPKGGGGGFRNDFDFRFGVFICGTYPPLSSSSSSSPSSSSCAAVFPITPTALLEHQHWHPQHENILSTPSIHVIGHKDPFAHRSRLLARCSEPSTTTVLECDMGHQFPVFPAETQRLAGEVVQLGEMVKRRGWERQRHDLNVRMAETLDKVVEHVQVQEIAVQT